jgi:hypothetical protein
MVLSKLPAQRLRFEPGTCGVYDRSLVKQESLKLKSHHVILFLHILCFKSYSNYSRLINYLSKSDKMYNLVNCILRKFLLERRNTNRRLTLIFR